MEGGIDKASGTTIPASAGVVLRAVAQVLFFFEGHPGRPPAASLQTLPKSEHPREADFFLN